jgi:hypothetical protein
MAAAVVVLDVSLSMALNGVFEMAREVAVKVARSVSDSGSHHLGGLIAMAGNVRTLTLEELADVQWEYEHGYGLNLGEVHAAAHLLLRGEQGRLVLVTGFLFSDRDEFGTYIAPITEKSLSKGRDEIAAVSRAGLPLDAIWCVTESMRGHRALQACATTVGKLGGSLVAISDPSDPAIDGYLHRVWSSDMPT